MKKQFYYIEDIAEIFGMSVAAVQGQLARKQYSTIPAPVKVGRRLAWPVQLMEDFIEHKVQSCFALQNFSQAHSTSTCSAKPGRPTKRASLKRQKESAHE